MTRQNVRREITRIERTIDAEDARDGLLTLAAQRELCRMKRKLRIELDRMEN